MASPAIVRVLAIEATLAVSWAAAAGSVLCGHLTPPPGAVYLYGDGPTEHRRHSGSTNLGDSGKYVALRQW